MVTGFLYERANFKVTTLSNFVMVDLISRPAVTVLYKGFIKFIMDFHALLCGK